MSSANAPVQASRLAPRELAFLGLSILVWTGYVVWLGKDTSWDFRNYHWYIPYAFLNGRMDIDVAVAHQASYYNPLVDIPFYWLAIHTTSWFAIAVLGLFQAANIVPLYLMARHSLRHSESWLGSAASAFFGKEYQSVFIRQKAKWILNDAGGHFDLCLLWLSVRAPLRSARARF